MKTNILKVNKVKNINYNKYLKNIETRVNQN